MELKIKKHSSIWTIRKRWLALEENNEGQNVYQSYFVQKSIALRLPIYVIPGRYKPFYFEIIDGDETVLIAPLCKFWGEEKYSIIGKFNGIQSYDFIYDHTKSKAQMKEYLLFLFRSLKAEHISIYNMPESSLVFCIMDEMGMVEDVHRNENVNICFGKDYDKYLSGLSKHMRQNIRTAYNRIQNDNLRMRFEFYIKTPISRKKLNSLIDVYCHRHEKRYQVNTSAVKKLYLKYFDFSTYCQQHYKNVYAILYIEDKIAAFLSGLIDERADSAVIPRLSIDDTFSRYSPGIVLINEVAKKFTSEAEIENLDLSKGSEGYKISMGGKCYYSVDFNIRIGDL